MDFHSPSARTGSWAAAPASGAPSHHAGGFNQQEQYRGGFATGTGNEGDQHMEDHHDKGPAKREYDSHLHPRMRKTPAKYASSPAPAASPAAHVPAPSPAAPAPAPPPAAVPFKNKVGRPPKIRHDAVNSDDERDSRKKPRGGGSGRGRGRSSEAHNPAGRRPNSAPGGRHPSWAPQEEAASDQEEGFQQRRPRAHVRGGAASARPSERSPVKHKGAAAVAAAAYHAGACSAPSSKPHSTRGGHQQGPSSRHSHAHDEDEDDEDEEGEESEDRPPPVQRELPKRVRVPTSKVLDAAASEANLARMEEAGLLVGEAVAVSPHESGFGYTSNSAFGPRSRAGPSPGGGGGRGPGFGRGRGGRGGKHSNIGIDSYSKLLVTDGGPLSEALQQSLAAFLQLVVCPPLLLEQQQQQAAAEGSVAIKMQESIQQPQAGGANHQLGPESNVMPQPSPTPPPAPRPPAPMPPPPMAPPSPGGVPEYQQEQQRAPEQQQQQEQQQEPQYQQASEPQQQQQYQSAPEHQQQYQSVPDQQQQQQYSHHQQLPEEQQQQQAPAYGNGNSASAYESLAGPSFTQGQGPFAPAALQQQSDYAGVAPHQHPNQPAYATSPSAPYNQAPGGAAAQTNGGGYDHAATYPQWSNFLNQGAWPSNHNGSSSNSQALQQPGLGTGQAQVSPLQGNPGASFSAVQQPFAQLQTSQLAGAPQQQQQTPFQQGVQASGAWEGNPFAAAAAQPPQGYAQQQQPQQQSMANNQLLQMLMMLQQQQQQQQQQVQAHQMQQQVQQQQQQMRPSAPGQSPAPPLAQDQLFAQSLAATQGHHNPYMQMQLQQQQQQQQMQAHQQLQTALGGGSAGLSMLPPSTQTYLSQLLGGPRYSPNTPASPSSALQQQQQQRMGGNAANEGVLAPQQQGGGAGITMSSQAMQHVQHLQQQLAPMLKEPEFPAQLQLLLQRQQQSSYPQQQEAQQPQPRYRQQQQQHPHQQQQQPHSSYAALQQFRQAKGRLKLPPVPRVPKPPKPSKKQQQLLDLKSREGMEGSEHTGGEDEADRGLVKREAKEKKARKATARFDSDGNELHPLEDAKRQRVGGVLQAMAPQVARQQAKKLESKARLVAEVQLNFTEMCAKLTALGYSSVDVLIDDVRNHSQQHLRQFLSTVEPSRRAKQLSSQMEAFTEGIVDGIHHIAMRTAAAEGKRGELQASLGGCRARDELHGLTVSGGELPMSIQTNTEPYIQGEWRRTPYEARPYETLTSYAIRSSDPEEVSMLRWKLTTRRGDAAAEHFHIDHAQDLGPERLKEVEASLVEQVRCRDVLRMGVDVQEVDCWGMDCFTRKNVFDVAAASLPSLTDAPSASTLNLPPSRIQPPAPIRPPPQPLSLPAARAHVNTAPPAPDPANLDTSPQNPSDPKPVRKMVKKSHEAARAYALSRAGGEFPSSNPQPLLTLPALQAPASQEDNTAATAAAALRALQAISAYPPSGAAHYPQAAPHYPQQSAAPSFPQQSAATYAQNTGAYPPQSTAAAHISPQSMAYASLASIAAIYPPALQHNFSPPPAGAPQANKESQQQQQQQQGYVPSYTGQQPNSSMQGQDGGSAAGGVEGQESAQTGTAEYRQSAQPAGAPLNTQAGTYSSGNINNNNHVVSTPSGGYTGATHAAAASAHIPAPVSSNVDLDPSFQSHSQNPASWQATQGVGQSGQGQLSAGGLASGSNYGPGPGGTAVGAPMTAGAGVQSAQASAMEMGALPVCLAESDAIHAWVDRELIPASLRLGSWGWSMQRVLEDVKKRARQRGHAHSVRAAEGVLQRLQQVGWNYFRLHPKGRGVTCHRPDGIPRFQLVEEYLGELHSGWRWFEIQETMKKVMSQELPDFYNIMLERPRDDPDGYDVLFVEAAFMASFASRMSHSCTPNCQALVVTVGGRLTIAMYSVRDIAPGEELTFDYASVTESEKDFRGGGVPVLLEEVQGVLPHLRRQHRVHKGAGPPPQLPANLC
ncbi:MAG: hypothetical protein WDW36_001407 [Sanguina aurantia]